MDKIIYANVVFSTFIKKVFFITNRVQINEKKVEFSGKLSRDYKCGEVNCHVGPGTYTEGSSNFVTFKSSSAWEFNNDLHGAFWQSVLNETRYKKNAFVFIHGFNISFESGMKKLAQFSTDLQIDGPAILLSWASNGNLKAYKHDQITAKNISLSFGVTLASILRILIENCPDIKVHLLCHSMGSRIFAYGIKQLHNNITGKQKFASIILAAADLSVNQFLKNVDKMLEIVQRGKLIILCSPDDVALKLLSTFQKQRIGLCTTISNGIKTVVLPAVTYEDVSIYIYKKSDFRDSTDSIFHAYVYKIPEIIEHIRIIIGIQPSSAAVKFKLINYSYNFYVPK